MLLILVEAFDGVRLPRSALVALAAGVAIVLVSDVRVLRQFGGYARIAFARQAAMLRRAQCDPQLPADLSLDPVQAPGVTVGPYLAAVRALGSPPGQACTATHSGGIPHRARLKPTGSALVRFGGGLVGGVDRSATR